MKRLWIVVLAFACVLSLSGCSQIFKDTKSQYELTGVNAPEMVSGKFYVKNGTKFYAVYFPSANFKSNQVVNISKASRIYWLGKDESLIPTYYKGELIAYSSEDVNIGTVSLERFKDTGYSFGMYGGVYDEAGYISFTTSKLVPGTSAATALSKAKAKDIRIVSINNTPVTAESIDKSGVFVGLDPGKSYEVSYYSGTYYNTVTLQADEWFFESFEVHQIKEATLTKNGFIAIEMPEDAKSGWYMINGQGLFKYYALEKGSSDIASADMNEAYYLSEQAQIEEFSQQYLVSIPDNTTDIAISLEYSMDQYEEEEIISRLTAPDGTIYTLTGSEGTLTCMLKEAMAGKWVINVYPRDLYVTDIRVSSTNPEADAVSDNYTYTIDEAQSSIEFYATYTGADTVWGYVTDELGATTKMVLDEKKKRLYCSFAYLPEGKYTITVYHYADTSVTDGNWGRDSSGDVTEIITVIE